jgi:hypothetical protein
MAKKNPHWFWQLLTARDTKRDDGTPVISEADIEEERASGMSEDLIEQEFYCSFERVGGQAFNFRRDDHVIAPLPIPRGAPIYFTFDWGYGAPFSIGWWWVDADGRGYRFSEWYGASISNAGKIEGLRLTDDEIAEGIKTREEELEIWGQRFPRLAGPDCFSKKPDYKGGGQGPSTAEVFARHKIYLSPGDPDRELKIRQFRGRLRIFEQEEGKPKRMPMLVVYKGCEHFIRTIPLIPVSKHKPEDVDTTSEDHCYDEACHFCMARPLALKQPEKRGTVHDRTIEELESGKRDDYEDYARREQQAEMGRLGRVDIGPEIEVDDGARRDLVDTIH